MILRKLEGSRFSEIVREWTGTVAILGGGPSLTIPQFAKVTAAHAAGQLKCIAINDSYLMAPYADVLYAPDVPWHNKQRQGVAKPKLGLSAAEVSARYEAFAGLRCCVEQGVAVDDDRVHILASAYFPIRTALTLHGNDLVSGRNSVHQAMNLAIRAGASRTLLLGCDGGPMEGQTHWHGGHGDVISPEFWNDMRRSFSAAEHAIAATGAEVINCNPASRIDSFRKMELADALCL